ncbi:hypothetical protein BDB00DRAFT_793335 [Zychaea mexicana]|uniref:uncharacterized protein n=1 Tax=Zychaea mexicana TaxID=64656 RepID=UPI0022FF1D9A|nr:uncharacterized protein BDB00DRAFT_793335 [Zychaea mexicana]KAI9477061.1 hypothetical protein BDB00DRAFT_793335 [Zychaea mexicana]
MSNTTLVLSVTGYTIASLHMAGRLFNTSRASNTLAGDWTAVAPFIPWMSVGAYHRSCRSGPTSQDTFIISEYLDEERKPKSEQVHGKERLMLCNLAVDFDTIDDFNSLGTCYFGKGKNA